MPIYEYCCEQCGHHMERIQKISDEPLKECPECGKPQLKKLISASRFQLKGTGWYETDFKHKGKAPEKPDTSSAKSSEKSSDKSSAKSSGKDSKSSD